MRFTISVDTFWYDIKAQHGERGGIYVLSCLDETGCTQKIHRLLGEDPEGVLYIGKASSFLDRVIELKKSLSPLHESRGHECGARHKEHQGISAQFPYERLQIQLIAADDPRGAETKALQQYIEKFGELPPLNRVS